MQVSTKCRVLEAKRLDIQQELLERFRGRKALPEAVGLPHSPPGVANIYSFFNSAKGARGRGLECGGKKDILGKEELHLEGRGGVPRLRASQEWTVTQCSKSKMEGLVGRPRGEMGKRHSHWALRSWLLSRHVWVVQLVRGCSNKGSQTL